MGRYVHHSEVEEFILREMANLWRSGSPAIFHALPDEYVYLPWLGELEDFLAIVKPLVMRMSYKANGFDCDDYAEALLGARVLYQRSMNLEYSMCLGKVEGYFAWIGAEELHVCNWVVTDETEEMKMYWIEPQTAEKYNFDQILGEVSTIQV